MFAERGRKEGGIKINDELVSLTRLQQLLEEHSVAVVASSYDWPMQGGSPTRAAQAVGTPPLLDTTMWIVKTILAPDEETGKVEEETNKKEKPAKDRIDQAI